jgi:hypothetical protein
MLLTDTILPNVTQRLHSLSYADDFDEISSFLAATAEINSDREIDLTAQWRAMVGDVAEWASSLDDVWEDSATPTDVLRFINVIKEYQPRFFEPPDIKDALRIMLEQLRTRADADAQRSDDVEYEDQVAGRAEACSQLARTFHQFSLLPEAALLQSQLRDVGAEFGRTAEDLAEQIPEERDDDDRGYSPSVEAEVDIAELFSDL